MIKHSQDPEGTKHGAGYVTSASDDDHHRAHILPAGQHVLDVPVPSLHRKMEKYIYQI